MISGATKADQNAALLFENLHFSNYFSRERTSRLDRDETMATLKVVEIGIIFYRTRSRIFRHFNHEFGFTGFGKNACVGNFNETETTRVF